MTSVALLLTVQLMRGEAWVLTDMTCSDGPAWLERARAWAQRSNLDIQPQYICTGSDR